MFSPEFRKKLGKIYKSIIVLGHEDKELSVLGFNSRIR
jgi:hypothetical protein